MSRRHERQRYQPEVLRRLITEYEYQLKFVIDCAAELDEVEDYLQALPEVDPERVLLMPQGTTPEDLRQRATWLSQRVRSGGGSIVPRRQIEWFGTVRGT